MTCATTQSLQSCTLDTTMRWEDMHLRCVTPCKLAHTMFTGSDDTRTEREKMMAGDLYYSFAPKAADLEQDRAKCRIKVAVRPTTLLLHCVTLPQSLFAFNMLLCNIRRTTRPVG